MCSSDLFDIPGVGGSDAFQQGGTFIELTIPFDPPNGALNTVGNNTFQTPHLYAFDEDINVTIGVGTNLVYEYGADANRDQGTNPGTNADHFIDAGLDKKGGTLIGDGTTLYASHYVFFDPEFSTRIHGRVDFDAEIVAVFTSTNTLSASDILLNNGVTYQNPGLRGLENADTPIDVAGSSLYLDFQASTPGDYIRVLTLESSGPINTVPEAPTWAMLLAGVALVTARRRHQRAIEG